MSSVGRLFVVVNLVLAAIFVGSAASLIGTSDEWRGKYDEAVAAASSTEATLLAEKESLRGERDQQKRMADGHLNNLTQATADKTALEGELASERQQNADLRESFNGLDSKLGDLEQTNRSLATRIQELEREGRTLREERDSAFDERDLAVAEATQARQQAQLATGQVDNLMRTITAERDAREKAEATLATAVKLYNIDLSNVGGTPPLNGMILDVSYDNGAAIVLLNKGARDGVRPGHSFDVFQGSTYKGRVRVEVVNESNSAAVISLAGDGDIDRGDNFATSV